MSYLRAPCEGTLVISTTSSFSLYSESPLSSLLYLGEAIAPLPAPIQAAPLSLKGYRIPA